MPWMPATAAATGAFLSRHGRLDGTTVQGADMALSAGELARLRNLCGIFRTNPDTTERNPAAAFTVISMLYAVPAIADHAKRRDHGNKILQGAQPYFTPSDGPNAVRF